MNERAYLRAVPEGTRRSPGISEAPDAPVEAFPRSSIRPHAPHLSSMPPANQRVTRVLVVARDAVVAHAIDALIAHEGRDIQRLYDPTRLGAAITACEPDVVILGDKLDEVSGLELCGDLRSTEEGMRLSIVFFSEASPAETDLAQALRAGADDWVSLDRRLELRVRIECQLRNQRYKDSLRRVRSERDRLKVAASEDPLTRVPNRAALEEAVRQRMADLTPFGLIFIDIDFFKRVNDEHGHDAGDRVLCAVASQMKRGIRSNDFCARWGGEEFVIVADGADLATAERIANRHRLGIASMPVPDLGPRGRITVSMGVAAFAPAEPEPDPEGIFKRADEALYEAKRRGRNCVVPRTLSVSLADDPPEPVIIQMTGDAEARQCAIEVELQRQLGSGRAALPVLPTVAAEALRLADDPNADVTSFSKLVGRDPHFAARFMSIANSVVYSRGVKATSVREAIVRIGLSGARDLLFQVVYANAHTSLRHFQPEVVRCFDRSVTAAIAARLYCQKTGQDISFAYLFGLLHDIGEARVYRILAGIRDAHREKGRMAELVARHHARAGAEIAIAWRLPTKIVEACAYHHENGKESMPGVRITKISDVLATEAQRADGLTDASRATLSQLSVPGDVALAILNELRSQPR